MDVLGVKLVGVNAEIGHKLLLTVAFVAGIVLIRAGAVGIVGAMAGRHRNERLMFWTRQTASIVAALVAILALLSIWFDDPRRLTTGLGLFGAGLAFALQRVV